MGVLNAWKSTESMFRSAWAAVTCVSGVVLQAKLEGSEQELLRYVTETRQILGVGKIL